MNLLTVTQSGAFNIVSEKNQSPQQKIARRLEMLKGSMGALETVVKIKENKKFLKNSVDASA
ncbi:MAG: hypothetical protein ABIA63_00565 [bacterium]